MHQHQPPPAAKLRRHHLIALDCLVAAVLVVIGVANLAARAWEPAHLPAWLTWFAAFAIGGPVAVRRVWPRQAFAVAMAISVLCALDGGAWVTYFALALPVYTLAVDESRRLSLPALLITLAFTLAVNLAPPSRATLGAVGLAWTVLCSAWLIGRAANERRHYLALSAEQRTREAVTGERLRIARELHDVVAHSLSLVTVKASVAHHLADEHPAQAKTALGVIEYTAREALSEMRQILGVLRSNGEVGELAPAPGLAALGELAERARMAGVDVGLEVTADGLPEGVEVSAYRIVQEALTNVVKHAGPAKCRVRVAADEGAVRVEVTNDGPCVADGGPGHGLIGMRERVSLYDGTFHAGPRPEGGFAVTAMLPYD